MSGEEPRDVGADRVIEAVVSIQAPPDWKREIIHKYDARISMDDQFGHEDMGCKSLVNIETDPDDTDVLIEDVKCHPTVVEADLDVVGEGKIRGTVVTRGCIGCCGVAGNGAFLVEVTIDEDGRILQHLLASDKETIRRVVSDTEGRGHPVILERLSTLDPDTLLTSRQDTIMRFAYERGYFDEPRAISLGELSEMFDVTISTVSEILRKGQRKLIAEFLSESA
jgi:predicted DNA binding protein